MARVTGASVTLGVILAVAAHFRDAIETPLKHMGFAKEAGVLGLCVAGTALYPALLFAFGGVTPAETKALFRRRRGAPAAAPPADAG
jgi:putative peptidoglycan lipid II flippase